MTVNDEVEILIVEDREEDIELALRAFKKHNIANNIQVVKDGDKALEFIFARGEFSDRKENQQPKLILLDLKLPKVDGLKVLREIKTNERSKIIPVVVLTSSDEDTDINEAYRLGANSYIVKPVNFDNFVKAVTTMGLYWLLLNRSPLTKID